MKSLSTYFLESKEDGKYLDLPQSMSKPFFYPGIPKDQKELSKKKWKEYEESVIKINTENFEILIDKLKTAMTSKKGHNNFILNAQNCTFDNFYGKDENGNKDFFDLVEKATKEARIALETDDIKAASFTKARQPEKRNSWDKDVTLFWYDSTGFTFSIYLALSVIAQAYNVNIPKFNDKFNILKTDSVYSKYQEMWEQTSHSRNEEAMNKKSHKVMQKAEAEYEKDSKKIKKMREAFRKSDLYKDIVSILDKVEDDLEATEQNYKKWEKIFAEKIKKDEDAKKLADAIEKIKDDVQKVLEKSFGSYSSISWGVDNLYKLAAKAYLESDNKMPEIKELSNTIGSWLSGMHKTCEFEVIGANGTSYGKVKLQDKGLDGDDGKPVDGFGAWD